MRAGLLLLAAIGAAHAEEIAPFSFTVDGVDSRTALAGWAREARAPAPSGAWQPRYAQFVAGLDRTGVVTYTGPAAKVCFQREPLPGADAQVQYLTFTGLSQTGPPALADVCPLDTVFSFEDDGPIALHYAKGSHNEQTDFQPMEMTLEEGKPISFVPYGGRSSDGSLPYFNLASPKGGVIVAIGWTGQWKATFERAGARRVRVTAGMERTNIRLRAGESFGTPAVLVLRWTGADWIDGQNALRRLMLRHFTPQRDGAPVVPPIAASPHGYIGFNDTTQANLIESVKRIAGHAFPVDTFWLDAGWGKGGFPLGMGNPDPDPARFPNGLKPVSDAAHAHGLNYLQWFEPERAMKGTWLDAEHAEWLLTPVGLPPELAYHEKDGFRLLDLGNEEAREWITQKISSQIAEYGVDIYRQDFNMCPLYYWRNGEPAGREGLREVRYIEGLYAFLDALRAKHPGLIIDNCASGGRRLDFEMVRRCLFLWRTDDCWDPIAEQCMTHALSLWLPVHGVGAVSLDPYDFRSGMGSSFTMALDFRSDDPKFWEQASARVNELMRVRAFFSKDYYPLTPYTVADDAWIAWQFHDPEKDAGIVQAFRRAKASGADLTVKLRGLGAANTYRVLDFDSPAERTKPAAELTEHGLDIAIGAQPGSALLMYSRVSQ